MLEPYAERMHVSADAPGYYGVDMAPEAERTPATWFAGTRLGKRYVSYTAAGRLGSARQVRIIQARPST